MPNAFDDIDFAMLETPGVPYARTEGEDPIQARLERSCPVYSPAAENDALMEPGAGEDVVQSRIEMRQKRNARHAAFLASQPVLTVEEYRNGRGFVWVSTKTSWTRFRAESFRQHSDELRSAIRSAIALNPGCQVVVSPVKPAKVA
jgi:hypothetical protein